MRAAVLTFQLVLICAFVALLRLGLDHMGWDFTLGAFTMYIVMQVCSYLNKGHLLDIL